MIYYELNMEEPDVEDACRDNPVASGISHFFHPYPRQNILEIELPPFKKMHAIPLQNWEGRMWAIPN